MRRRALGQGRAADAPSIKVMTNSVKGAVVAAGTTLHEQRPLQAYLLQTFSDAA